jgi:hypothetical protein
MERRDGFAGEKGPLDVNKYFLQDREDNRRSLWPTGRGLQIYFSPHTILPSSLSSEHPGGLTTSTSAGSLFTRQHFLFNKLNTSTRKRMGIYPINFLAFTFLSMTFLPRVSAELYSSSAPMSLRLTTLSTTTSASIAMKLDPLVRRTANNNGSLSHAATIGIPIGVILFVIIVISSVLFCKYCFRREQHVYTGAPTTSRAWGDEEHANDLTDPSALEREELQSMAPSSRRQTFVEHLFPRGSRRSERASRKEVIPEQGMEVCAPGLAGPIRDNQRSQTFMEHLFHRESRRSERASRKEVVPEPGLETIPSNGHLSQHQSPVVSPLSATPLSAQDAQPSGSGTQPIGGRHELPTMRLASSHQTPITPLSRHRLRSQPDEPCEMPAPTHEGSLRRHFFPRRGSNRSRQRSHNEDVPNTAQELTALQPPPTRPHPLEQVRANRRANQPNRMLGYNDFEAIVEQASPPVSPIDSSSFPRGPGIDDEEFYVTPEPREAIKNAARHQAERARAQERRRATQRELEDLEPKGRPRRNLPDAD